MDCLVADPSLRAAFVAMGGADTLLQAPLEHDADGPMAEKIRETLMKVHEPFY